MTRKRAYRIFIKDILESINKIEQFISGLEYHQFVSDDKTMSAVVRKLEIIGEAVKNLPLSVRRKYPGVEWRDMAGMRDKLIYDYFGVDTEIVWKVIKEELPGIKPVIEKMFGEVTKEGEGNRNR